MDRKDEAQMNLEFTTTLNDSWKSKIRAGLHTECATLTKAVEDFEPHAIYATHNDNFFGGIIAEQHGDILWIDVATVNRTVYVK